LARRLLGADVVIALAGLDIGVEVFE